jgi:hypothetical protein
MSNLERNLSAPINAAPENHNMPVAPEVQAPRRNTAYKSGKIITAAAALVAALAAGKAQAQEPKRPCVWSLEGKDQTSVTVPKDKEVKIGLISGEQGKVNASEGVTVEGFEKGQCLIGDREKCGRWSAHTTADQSKTVKMSIADGKCEGESREFRINLEEPVTPPAPVDPNEAHWTLEEKEEVEDHLANATDGERWFDVGLGLHWYPNTSDVTQVGLGPHLEFNGRPGSKHVTLGAALRWTRDGQPIWEGLRPQNTMETLRDSYTAMFRAAGVLTGDWGGADWDWFQLSLGGEAGLTVMHHGQEDIGEGRVVNSDTRVSPVIGAYGKLALCPHENVCFMGAVEGSMEVVPRQTNAGTEGIEDAPKKVIHGKPDFTGGMQFNF